MRSPGMAVAHSSRVLAEYWHESGRPLASLAFVLPMLLAYEGGLLWLGPQAMRNGADVWLRRLLEGLGFSQYFLLPLVTCSILLGWHHVKREPWRVGYAALHGMWIESLVFGTVLLAAAHLQGVLIHDAAAADRGRAGAWTDPPASRQPAASRDAGWPVAVRSAGTPAVGVSWEEPVLQRQGNRAGLRIGRAVSNQPPRGPVKPHRPGLSQAVAHARTGKWIAFLGAGIYEELLFRLMLLPVLFALLRGTGLSDGASWRCAVVAGSLLFAAAHYHWTLELGPLQLGVAAGEPFAWMSFGFRALAGVFFSLLFLHRGFGVAAGTHAVYDILVAA